MKTIKLFLFFCLTSNLFAQNAQYQWAVNFGTGSGNIFSDHIAVDDSGNIYSAGIFAGTKDFDPGPGVAELTSYGDDDIFVQKCDSNGTFIWVRRVGGLQEDWGISVAADANGNVFTVGRFRDSVDFDPGPQFDNHIAIGIRDCFVQKLDTDGNFQWARTFGSIATEYDAVATDPLGNVYLTGYFTDTVDFDPGPGTSILGTGSDTDAMIQKLDANGNLVWVKQLTGISNQVGQDINVDSLGNVYVLGSFKEDMDADPGPGVAVLSSLGQEDLFVLKLDDNGDLTWAKQIAGTNFDRGTKINIDAAGNVYCSGIFEGTNDFDPGPANYFLTSADDNDAFVLKLDEYGTFEWVRQFSGILSQFAFSALDSEANVYTTGHFQGSVDFNPVSGTGTLDESGGGVYLQKMDTDGNFLWVRQLGASGGENATDIVLDSNDRIYVRGMFWGTMDCNPGAGVANLNSSDGRLFLLKLAPCQASYSVQTHVACKNFTWIDGNTYWTTTNEPQIIYENSTGCDSIISLNLTINNVPNLTNSFNGMTITSNNTTASSYQWLDCFNGFAIIPGANTSQYTASQDGSYAVEVTDNGCTDTSYCVYVSSASIDEFSIPEAFQLVPNPTKDVFQIIFEKQQQNLKVTISTINSKVITSEFYEYESDVHLHLNELPSGIYLVRISSSTIDSTVRILKE